MEESGCLPASADARHPDATLALQVVDAFPYGIVVVSRSGRVLVHNPAAARLLGPLAERLEESGARVLCELLGCRHEDAPLGDVCPFERAIDNRAPLPEIRIDLPPGAAVPAAWVTVAPLAENAECAIGELRPGRANDRRRRTVPHWTRGPELRISALGRTRVESAEGSLGGQWLDNRAGQVLKLLVAERRRVVYADEMVETLLPDAGVRSAQGVRYYIHQLRELLEPERTGRGQSSFIARDQGGYLLDRERVAIDVDEFEREASTGLTAADAGDEERACRHLERAAQLYGGDFLADEPYAEWAIAERDRLRTVAANALRVLAELRLGGGDFVGAVTVLERLADLEPYDVDVHRRLIALSLRRGRRSEAVRRYNALRRRMLTTFGEELEFSLSDVAAA